MSHRETIISLIKDKTVASNLRRRSRTKDAIRALQTILYELGYGLTSPQNWGTAAERRLINAYLKIRETHGRYPMTHAAKRAAVTKKYLDNGIISDERGSFQFNI